MNVSIGGIAKTVEITSFDKLGDVKVCMLTTTADGSVGFEQLSDEVKETIYASFPVDTLKGSIASFEDGADNVPVRKLTLNLVPYQGGSGEPAPDNVRPIYPVNGKNLLQVTGTSKTENEITYTVNDDGTVTAKGTASANANLVYSEMTFDSAITGNFLLNGNPTGASSATYRMRIRSYSNGAWNAWQYADDTSDLSVSLSSATQIQVHLIVLSGQTVNNIVFKPMLRHAEITDSVYVPYNAIGITRTGKNLLPNLKVQRSTTYVYLGQSIGTNTFYGVHLKAGTYTISCNNSVSAALYIKSNTQSTQMVNSAQLNNYGTVTLPVEDDYAIWLYRSSGITTNDVTQFQLETGSSATAYEPYQGERYYPTSANPVYGGTLEVETGVLTVDKGHKSFDGSENWQRVLGSGGIYRYNVNGLLTGSKRPTSNSINANLMSNMYESKTANQTYGGTQGISQQANTDDVYVFDSTYSALTVADWKTHLGSNNLQVVYELATPQTYQLTPTQVKTLLGYNNIWTDSGTVEVQYRANIGLYIQKIIGSSEDDMIANQNIAANQYFFVGEELYYSTSAISAGQTIIVGTNCIKTTLADALNALNS